MRPRKVYSRMNYMISRFCIAIFAVVVGLAAGCTTDQPLVPTQPGELVSYDYIKTYSADNLKWVTGPGLDLFFKGGTMPADAYRADLAVPQQGVKVYKVAYKSIIPENVKPGAPVVSYQHGTIFERSWTPSNPDGSIETLFMLTQFASQGYIVIAADYFGTTQGSTLPNSYFVAQSSAQACLDMYRASMEILRRENITPGKLFINGWSQGGYSTLAFLRYLELANVPVAAAATASGPADPLLFVTESMNNPSPFAAAFIVGALSNLMLSMDAYQGLDGYFEQAINPKYLEYARRLHKFEMPYDSFAVKVPHKPDSVYTAQFYEDSRIAIKPFWKMLDAGAAYRWRMRTPLRVFYSYTDEAIPWQVARIAADYQKTLGHPSAEAIDAGKNTDHRAVYIYSLINIKPWFDSLR
jgi:hypothetical protein